MLEAAEQKIFFTVVVVLPSNTCFMFNLQLMGWPYQSNCGIWAIYTTTKRPSAWKPTKPRKTLFCSLGIHWRRFFNLRSSTTGQFFSYLDAQKNLSRWRNNFFFSSSPFVIHSVDHLWHVKVWAFFAPATRHRCKFFCGGLSMNFIVFIEWLGRKLIVFCVSVCLPHTPIQIWRLHLERFNVHLAWRPFCDAKKALHMAKKFSPNCCNGRSFTHLWGHQPCSAHCVRIPPQKSHCE